MIHCVKSTGEPVLTVYACYFSYLSIAYGAARLWARLVTTWQYEGTHWWDVYCFCRSDAFKKLIEQKSHLLKWAFFCRRWRQSQALMFEGTGVMGSPESEPGVHGLQIISVQQVVRDKGWENLTCWQHHRYGTDVEWNGSGELRAVFRC